MFSDIILAQNFQQVPILSGKENKEEQKTSLSYKTLSPLKKKPRFYEIGFNYGRWYLAGSSKLPKDGSLTDLQNCKDMFGARFSYVLHKNINLGALLSVMISIPPQNISLTDYGDSLSVEAKGNGGGVFAFFAGTRFFIFRDSFRPYIALYPGMIYAYAKGGKVSGKVFSTSKVIAEEKETSFAIRAEGGVEYELGTSARLESGLAYIRSSEFREPVGGIRNFRGWNIYISISYLF